MYTKIRHYSSDENECQLETDKCDPNAICQDREPTKQQPNLRYMCTCKTGFRGTYLLLQC